MKKDLTLLVLAAGMGSRFGGLKQIAEVGPNKEFIIDYSIYDAIRAGFNKVVFVIKKENYDVFRDTIGKRLENKIKVEYAFQSLEDIPLGFTLPIERVKPLGTAHAVYAARDKIHENFMMINSDDFYGYDGYVKGAEFLSNCNDNEYANIAYEVNNTLTENGSVKRGILFTTDGYLDKSIESSVEKIGDKIICSPLDGSESFEVSKDMSVSMNMFCFTPKIFEFLENNIKEFLNNSNNLVSDEYLMSDCAVESASVNNTKIKVIKTGSKWYGMTYKEDLEGLKKGILEEIEKGNYNSKLWE